MTFPFNLYLLSFFCALFVTALSLPFWRRWASLLGMVDDPGHRKIHQLPVPLAGGLAILSGMILTLALAAAIFLWHDANTSNPPTAFLSKTGLEPFAFNLLAYGLSHRFLQLAAILLGAIGMLALGALDDRRDLAPLPKFAGQLAIASLVAASGVRITLFIDNALFSYLVTILWILTITNATNFIDNMNGLCTGLGLIASWAFAWTAAYHGQYLVAAIGFLVSGALLGFLPFNFPRASVFLGDAGSHLIGYLLAILAILPHFYANSQPHRLAVLKPILILGVILADLLSVLWIRWRLHRPFYLGDQNHFSHRLVRRGLSHSSTVLLLWLTAAILASLAFL
jgi:UDP-GlcNAc:undecaprenyl-phosphate/decaprenyl-phosphate GlcNAc-1-phosphate transferase